MPSAWVSSGADMASLDDTLARLAPKTVEGLQVEWNLDSAGAWIEVAGWFSPGTRFGEPKYQVPFKKTVAKTGDTVYDISIGVADVLDQVAGRLKRGFKVDAALPVGRKIAWEAITEPTPWTVAAEPVKRKAGRPKGSKNRPSEGVVAPRRSKNKAETKKAARASKRTP
jgi:hypothetical protein